MKREALLLCISQIYLYKQTILKSGISKRYYDNQNQTGTDTSGDLSRGVWTLYYIIKWKSNAIRGVIKSIVWNVN